MSEENHELSPDELMAQQFGEDMEGTQKTEATQEAKERESAVDADELMVQQFAQQSYERSSKSDLLKDNSKVSMLLDIPLEVTVEIGSAEMPIEDVLKLNPNSIIELDRFVNEPIDLKVNGRVIAKGELYTVKNNFGIKITQIVTPEDRLKILDM